jgi:GNAT superfamily N-acetyltransferase
VGGLDLNELRLLYVRPSHQGKGIGSALLSHLESMVPAALFADIFVYSTLASVDFYRARGFSIRGEYAFEVGPDQLTTVFMTKPTVSGWNFPDYGENPA